MGLSLYPNDPRSSLFKGHGVAVHGGPRGLTASGRLMEMSPKLQGRTIRLNGRVEPRHPNGVPGSLALVVNGAFVRFGGSEFYSVNRLAANEGLSIELYPSPRGNHWKSWRSVSNGVYTPRLRLTWNGDPESTRYTVQHSLVANHSDKKVIAINSINTNITIENLTGSGNDVVVTGVDGNAIGQTHYTIEVTMEVVDFTSTLVITNVDTGEVSTHTEIEQDQEVAFGLGLSVQVPEAYQTLTVTTFDVTVTPKRHYDLLNPTNGLNYFRILAERSDGDTKTPSSWQSFDVNLPPSPVSNVSFAFVTAGEVDVSFNLPNDTDIAGAWLLHSRPEVAGYNIPWGKVREVLGTSGQSKTISLTGLSVGRYDVLIRAFNDDKIDDHGDYLLAFFLSLTGVTSFSTLKQPYRFTVKPDGLGKALFSIRTSGTEDAIYLYSNDGSGDIDYDTVWDIIPASERSNVSTYSSSYSGIPAGTYKFGARSSLIGVQETNITAIDEVTLYDDGVNIPYDLELEVIG